MAKKPGAFSTFIKKVYSFFSLLLGKLSKLFDRIVYSTRASLVVSLLAAVLICVTVNFEDLNYRFFNKDEEVLNLSNVPVQAVYDTNEYVVDGLPDTVSVTLSGSPGDMALYKTQYKAEVTADMRNLSTGKNSVELEATNVPNAIKAVVNPPSAEVTILKKTTRNYMIQPMLVIGTGQSQDSFTVDSLSQSTVSIKATKAQLDSIRMVRALIDTSGQNKDFTATAVLVAYDSAGNVVNVEIVPETIEVHVKYSEVADKDEAAKAADPNQDKTNEESEDSQNG